MTKVLVLWIFRPFPIISNKYLHHNFIPTEWNYFNHLSSSDWSSDNYLCLEDTLVTFNLKHIIQAKHTTDWIIFSSLFFLSIAHVKNLTRRRVQSRQIHFWPRQILWYDMNELSFKWDNRESVFSGKEF